VAEQALDRDRRWWLQKGAEAGTTLVAETRSIMENQDNQKQANTRHLRLYRNLINLGFAPRSLNLAQLATGKPLSLNVIRAMANTMHSKITKNRPRAMFVTTGADWKARRKAKLLEKYSEGIFHRTQMYRKTQQAFLDALIFGTGVVKVFQMDGDVVCERVFPGEIIIDDTDGIYGDPRAIRQVRFIAEEPPEMASPSDSPSVPFGECKAAMNAAWLP